MDILRELVQAGAGSDLQDLDGDTPLMLAAYFQKLEVDGVFLFFSLSAQKMIKHERFKGLRERHTTSEMHFPFVVFTL